MCIPKFDEEDDENDPEEYEMADVPAEAPQDPNLVHKPEAGGGPSQPQPHDYWLKRGYFMARIHNIPRAHKFSPLECEDRPEDVEGGIPVENFDVTRLTYTNLHEFGKHLTRIDDVWTGAEGDKQPVAKDVHAKFATWTGETWFEPIGPLKFKGIDLAAEHQVWIRGQMVTQDSVTARPRDCLPIEWKSMSPLQRREVIKLSTPRLKNVEDAKLARTIPYTRIEEDTATAFNFTEKKIAISAHQKPNSDQQDVTKAGGDLLADVPPDEESDEHEMTMCNICGKLRGPHLDTTTKRHECYRNPRFLDRESCRLENGNDPNYMYKGDFCSHKHRPPQRQHPYHAITQWSHN